MTLYAGSRLIGQIYHGSQAISRVYKGSTLVFGYFPGEDLIEESTAGTYSFTVEYAGNFRIVCVGAGGGGSSNLGGAGGYFEANVYLRRGTVDLVVGEGGYGGGAYCRNNNGGTGGESSITADGVSIVCPGGRYGCGRRNSCGAGYTYAPTYTITNAYTLIGVSTELQTGDSWYGGYGAGGAVCTNDEGAGYAGGDGYVLIEAI